MAGNTDLRRVFIEVTGTSEQARQELNDLRRSIAAADRQDAVIDVDVDGVAKAQAEIAAVQQAMVDLNGTSADPRIRIKVDDARARLAELENDVASAMSALESKNIDIGAGKAKTNVPEVRELQRALRAVDSEVVTVERSMRRWAAGMIDPADNLNAGFRGLVGLLKQVGPLLQGVGLVIFATLLPALAGLASGAVAAAGGIAALGPAALAAGGAMAVGLIAVVKSVGEVLDLRKRKQQALDSQTRQAAQRDDQLASANRTLAEAQRSVRDSLEQRRTAQRNVQNAEKQALEGIRNAQATARDTAADLRRQVTAAYDAMRDSALDARKAVIAFSDAQLDARESKLDLRDAKRALRDYARAAGGTIEDLGRKFEEVDYDPKKLTALISKARKTGAAGGGEADELERLTIAVERARNREKSATLGVTDAQNKLKDARRTEADYAARGIAAYEPYTRAVQANTKAQRELAKATAEGVKGNPQVIAAREQLRDANQRFVESEQRVADAVRARGDVLKGDTTGPMALYRKELDALTGGQRRLYDALDSASGPFKAFRDLIADPVLSGAAGAIDAISQALGGANGWASQLGTIGKENIEGFVDAAKGDPKNAQGLALLGLEALRTARILGGPVFQNFIRLMRNFAVALLPLLNDGFERLGAALGRAADRTDDWQALQDRMRPLVRLAGAFASVIAAAVGAIFDLGRALEPVLTPLLGWLKRGIQGFRDFTNSAKGGDRIRTFFDQVLPLVKSVIGFVVTFGRVLLQAFQFAAPIIKPIVDLLTGVLNVIGWILERLNAIPAPIRGLLGLFIPFGFIARVLRGVGKAIEGVGIAGKLLVAPIRFAVNAIIGLAYRIAGPFLGAFARIEGAAAALANLLRVPFGLIKAIGGAAVRGIVVAFSGGWDRIKSIFSGVGSFFSGVFGGLGRLLSSIFDGVIGIVKGTVNVLIGLVNTAIDGINLAIRGYNKIPLAPDIGEIGKIPKLATGGVARTSTLAEIGEGRYDEAVLPLSAGVLSSIGDAIVAATPRLATTAPGAGTGSAPSGSTTTIGAMNVYPVVPGGGPPNTRALSRDLAREIERLG